MSENRVTAHSGHRYWKIRTDTETSERMGRVRQKHTEPEVVLRSELWRRGHRYTLDNSDLPGSPDIANRSRRWAIFVHGCYWHRHPGCSKATTPKRNRDFWLDKFAANVKRDRRAIAELKGMEFSVFVVWECELSDANAASDAVRSFEATQD